MHRWRDGACPLVLSAPSRLERRGERERKLLDRVHLSRDDIAQHDRHHLHHLHHLHRLHHLHCQHREQHGLVELR